MKKEFNWILFRKLLFIGLILLSLVVIIIVAYVSTVSANKVTKDTVFADKDKSSLTEVSNERFLEKFNYFDIYATSIINAYKDGNGNIVNGSMTFTVDNDLKTNYSFTNNRFTVVLKLGASVIGWTSNESTSTSVSTNGKSGSISINGIDTIFPKNGPLLFLKSKSPNLFAYVTWAEDVNGTSTSYYTIFEYDYNQYSTTPVHNANYVLVHGNEQANFNKVSDDPLKYEIKGVHLNKNELFHFTNASTNKILSNISLQSGSSYYVSVSGNTITAKEAGTYNFYIEITKSSSSTSVKVTAEFTNEYTYKATISTMTEQITLTRDASSEWNVDKAHTDNLVIATEGTYITFRNDNKNTSLLINSLSDNLDGKLVLSSSYQIRIATPGIYRFDITVTNINNSQSIVVVPTYVGPVTTE